eukprot:70940_1
MNPLDLLTIKSERNRMSESLFINSYNLEKVRMKDIDKACAHHKYVSTKSFISHIQRLVSQFKYLNMKKEKGERVKIKSSHILDTISTLIEDGCCKQCCLEIILKIPQIMSTVKHHCRTDAKKKYYITFVNCDNEYDLLILAKICFANCLQHLHIADLILNKSSLWIQLLKILEINLQTVETHCKYNCELMKRHQLNDLELIYLQGAYVRLLSLLCQIIKNISLFKEYHWKCIVSDRCKYIDSWLKFVQRQLDYSLFAEKEIVKCGYPCITGSCFVILICFALKYIQTDTEKYKVIHKWFSDIRRNNIFEYMMDGNMYIESKQYGLIMRQQFIFLSDSEYVRTCLKLFHSLSREVYLEKWNGMQCQNMKCSRRRNVRKNAKFKFKKCKLCRVARYCSKKCQKYDWNKQDHKLYCRKLKRLRKGWRKAKRCLTE